MATDAAIIKRLRQILNVSDLNVTTEKSIRLQLESEFSIDLSDRKKFLREQIQSYLSKRQEKEEAAAAKKKAKAKERRAKKRAGQDEPQDGEEKKKRGGGGLMKVCALSEELAAFLGVSELPRTEVVKGIWNYIREHNLQDPTNKRRINCDATLQRLLGTDSTDMFQLNRLLTVHIRTIPGPEGEAPAKKPKGEGGGKGGGFSQPLPLSDALCRFLNTGETALARSEVVKRVWAYIKEHNLQDPSDRRNIICDAAMAELFGVSNFNGFGMTKLLSPHFGKASDLPAAQGDEQGEHDDMGQHELGGPEDDGPHHHVGQHEYAGVHHEVHEGHNPHGGEEYGDEGGEIEDEEFAE